MASHQALEFRKFWGDKASLRQFRDSKIAEVAGLVIDILLFLLLPGWEIVEIDMFYFYSVWSSITSMGT